MLDPLKAGFLGGIVLLVFSLGAPLNFFAPVSEGLFVGGFPLFSDSSGLVTMRTLSRYALRVRAFALRFTHCVQHGNIDCQSALFVDLVGYVRFTFWALILS